MKAGFGGVVAISPEGLLALAAKARTRMERLGIGGIG
jgi:hypothetical protein